MSFDKILSKKNKSSHVKEDYWIPLSDLMTGLMMIFMLIAISYMIKMEDETKKIKMWRLFMMKCESSCMMS